MIHTKYTTISQPPPTSHLPSSSDIGDGDDTRHVVHEDDPGDAEGGRDADAKATVAIQQHRMTSV